jgi:AmiR/NasT family two-component response regulator
MASRLLRFGKVRCEAGDLSGHLRVLLADSDVERATALELRLREITDAVIFRVPAGGTLRDAVAAQLPDVIIVDMARPDRDALDDLRRVDADNPRPVVMAVDRDDRRFMEEAIAAGVSSYDVVDTPFPMSAQSLWRRSRSSAAISRLPTTCKTQGRGSGREKR